MRNLIWVPEESYSNIMILDIRVLFRKTEERL